jgi:hypothetical protein
VETPREQVPPGEMREHLKNRAVRLVRAGMLDPRAVGRALCAEFEAVRVPGAVYEGDETDALEMAKWAAEDSDIAKREAQRASIGELFGGKGAESAGSDDLLVDMREAMRHASDPIPYLIEPIAVRGLVTVLVGRHSSMKSWLMMLGAAATHRGAESVADYATTHAPALYIDAEMGARLMAKRFRLAGIPDDAFHVADGFRLRLPKSKARIAELIKRTGARLVVMDSLRRLAPGSRENDSDDMSPIMACLAELSRELDVAIVLIHHRSTKEGAAETRGSSAIEDQADIVLALERVKDDPEADAGRRRLRTVKFRPDEEPAPTWVRFGGGLLRFTIEPAEPYGEGDSPKPRDGHRARVLAALGDSPRSARDLATNLGIAGTTMRRILRDLESSDEARQTDDGWVRHHPVLLKGRDGGAPPENGSTMRDLGAPPPVAHPVAGAPPGAPRNGHDPDAEWDRIAGKFPDLFDGAA